MILLVCSYMAVGFCDGWRNFLCGHTHHSAKAAAKCAARMQLRHPRAPRSTLPIVWAAEKVTVSPTDIRPRPGAPCVLSFEAP